MKSFSNSITLGMGCYILAFFRIVEIILKLMIGFFPLISYAQDLMDQSDVSLLMGGDISWSLTIRPQTVILQDESSLDADWRSVPYFNNDLAFATRSNTNKLIEYHLQFKSEDEMLHYPFQKLLPILHEADIVFFNLETPLSDKALMMGISRTPTRFASVLRDIGTSLVSIANNHTHDADVPGFLDTIKSLNNATISYIGGGSNISEARKPAIFEMKGIKIGFLGYTQFSNRGEPAFAATNRPGVAPMDPKMMREDIIKLRPKVDHIVVSIHWGTDKSANVSNANRSFAHELIDAGADIVFGHHTPFPKGIEVYKGKAIIYSPSHVFIGHNYAEWGDNYLVRFILGKKYLKRMEVLPISGTGLELAQPALLHGTRAYQLLNQIRKRSNLLNTEMQLHDDVGVIYPQYS